MTVTEIQAELETFREFKASFYYGSRTDLLFKWLERLPDDQGAEVEGKSHQNNGLTAF